MSMNELEKERLEVLIKDMSIADLKWLCGLIPSINLVNEIGIRLLRLEKHSSRAKESLDKVVI